MTVGGEVEWIRNLPARISRASSTRLRFARLYAILAAVRTVV